MPPPTSPSTSTPPSPPSPYSRDLIPSNRSGRNSTGLYPNLSRTKLAEATGLHPSTIVGLLRGRRKIPLNLALKIAAEVGVSVERLNADWEEQQRKYKAAEETKKLVREMDFGGTAVETYNFHLRPSPRCHHPWKSWCKKYPAWKVGWGETEVEALADLHRQMTEAGVFEQDGGGKIGK